MSTVEPRQVFRGCSRGRVRRHRRRQQPVRPAVWQPGRSGRPRLGFRVPSLAAVAGAAPHRQPAAAAAAPTAPATATTAAATTAATGATATPAPRPPTPAATTTASAPKCERGLEQAGKTNCSYLRTQGTRVVFQSKSGFVGDDENGSSSSGAGPIGPGDLGGEPGSDPVPREPGGAGGAKNANAMRDKQKILFDIAGT